jgi:hypothetical protein
MTSPLLASVGALRAPAPVDLCVERFLPHLVAGRSWPTTVHPASRRATATPGDQLL